MNFHAASGCWQFEETLVGVMVASVGALLAFFGTGAAIMALAMAGLSPATFATAQ